MKAIGLILIIGIFCSKCTDHKKDNGKEAISAEWKLESGESFDLRFYSDSMYVFTFIDSHFSHEINEKYRGRYCLNGDTINFVPFQFDYIGANKAIIKNNFIEFLDGRYPFKMKIVNSNVPRVTVLDTLRLKDYALFTYNKESYSYFSDSVRPYDLRESDLLQIDSLLNLCISENKHISRNFNDYYKQCTAVLNSNDEKEVWIYCLCKKSFFKRDEFQYRIVRVHDGGDCFFSVKINLTKRKYYELHINGYA